MEESSASAPGRTGLAESGWPMTAHLLKGLEVRRVDGALDQTEYSLDDGRCHLFLLVSGPADVVSPDGAFRLNPPALAWFPDEQADSVRQSAGSVGVLLSIPDNFLAHCMGVDVTSEQILQSVRRHQLARTVARPQLDGLLGHVQLLERELRNNGPGALVVLNRTLSIILVLLWRMSELQQMQPVAVSRNLVMTFLSLLDRHVLDHWSVADYADCMGISRGRLTSTLLRATGKKPLALIHSKMIEEARVLLTTSSKQVAQIAFSLGYADPAYFNRFFRRLVGVTPAKYRRNVIESSNSAEESFSAWP
ncbi:MAG: helix-turn-helix domain-containing protein [Burkholderiaceae bacterium]